MLCRKVGSKLQVGSVELCRIVRERIKEARANNAATKSEAKAKLTHTATTARYIQWKILDRKT